MTAFCAMGARASPHSALLGTHDLGPTDPNAPLTSVSAMAAGVRREQACRSLHQRAVDLTFDMDEILHDPSPVTFEALMVEVQMLAFAEFVPRKARTLIRLAFGQFQDLQNSQEIPDQVKQELSRSYSLPLFVSVSALADGRGRADTRPTDLRCHHVRVRSQDAHHHSRRLSTVPARHLHPRLQHRVPRRQGQSAHS